MSQRDRGGRSREPEQSIPPTAVPRILFRPARAVRRHGESPDVLGSARDL
jgi:hypothetical protein